MNTTNYKNNKSPKIIAGIFTIAILGLIIFAGPAKAFILKLDTDKDSLTKGGEITFTATLDIEVMDEYLPIKNLTLILDGPVNKQCVFDIQGNPVSGCDGMTIIPINIDLSGKHGYGYGYGYDSAYGYGYDFGKNYGYGYGYGAGGSEIHLVYEVTLDTTNYPTGNYESQLKALIGDKTFESKDKPAFTINAIPIYADNDETTGSGKGYFGFDKPAESQTDEEESEPIKLEKKETEEDKGLMSRMTGAVIGAVTSTTGIITIVFILALGGVFVGVRTLRKK